MFALEAHHDLFDRTVERPIFAPVDPETMTTEKHGTAECALRDVIAGIDTNDLFSSLRGADEHVFMNDIEIVVSGVILIVRETVKRDARHIDTRSVDDALIVGGRGSKITLVVIAIAQNIISNSVEEMIVLAGVMPGDPVLVTSHLHEYPAT